MEEGDVETYENAGGAGTSPCDTDCDEQSYNYKDDYLDMNYGAKHWLRSSKVSSHDFQSFPFHPPPQPPSNLPQKSCQ